MAGLVAAAVVSATATGGMASAPVARADAANDTAALCARADHPCSIRLGAVVREGGSYPVTVAGAPDITTSVQAYRVQLTGTQITGWQPFGSAQQVRLSSRGHAQVSLTLPDLAPDQGGGYLLVSVADLRDTDPASIVGSFTVLGAARPVLLGDGYGDDKPVDQVLDAQYYAALPSARYTVDIRADDGSWSDISAPRQDGDIAAAPGDLGHVRYALPRGLQPRPYSFRMRNIALGKVVAEWQASPSDAPQPAPRAQLWTPPTLGGNLNHVSSASGTWTHGAGPALWAVVGGLGLVMVAATAMVLRRRRRHRSVPASEEGHVTPRLSAAALARRRRAGLVGDIWAPALHDGSRQDGSGARRATHGDSVKPATPTAFQPSGRPPRLRFRIRRAGRQT